MFNMKSNFLNSQVSFHINLTQPKNYMCLNFCFI